MSNTLSVINEKGEELVLYEPDEALHQPEFHASTLPNLLALGTRGTGKSLQLRMDAHLRCLMVPNFRALIVRRTMPELRQSHLNDIEYEMKLLGGVYLHTTSTAKYPNGSTLKFDHCETEANVMNFLSRQYGLIGFDELSTFTLNQFLLISAAARAPLNAPYTAVVRAGSNTLGVGADWLQNWFISKTVRLEDYPNYNPLDYGVIYSRLEDNRHLDVKSYTARLQNLPEHVRRSWLNLEFIREGAYFPDFRKTKDGKPWHVIKTRPLWKGEDLTQVPWINIYRAIDWGYSPDPAVCLWIAVLPNKQAIVFKERTWKRTLAPDVAQQIKKESVGMHVVDSFCDPSMYIKTGVAPYSIAELFEQNGVSVTPCQNDRELFGYSINQYLNTIVDEQPQVQIVESACPELIRTIPLLQMDKNDPRKIAAGDDHHAAALAYFAMGQASPSRDPIVSVIPRWMQKRTKRHNYA